MVVGSLFHQCVAAVARLSAEKGDADVLGDLEFLPTEIGDAILRARVAKGGAPAAAGFVTVATGVVDLSTRSTTRSDLGAGLGVRDPAGGGGGGGGDGSDDGGDDDLDDADDAVQEAAVPWGRIFDRNEWGQDDDGGANDDDSGTKTLQWRVSPPPISRMDSLVRVNLSGTDAGHQVVAALVCLAPALRVLEARRCLSLDGDLLASNLKRWKNRNKHSDDVGASSLGVVDFACSPGMTYAGVVAVADHCAGSVYSLDISGPWYAPISVGGLAACVRAFHGPLRRLGLSMAGLGNNHLAALGESMGDQRCVGFLDLSGNDRITEEGLSQLLDGGDGEATGTRIGGVRVVSCPGIDGSGLALARGLTRLNLCGTSVDEETMGEILRGSAATLVSIGVAELDFGSEFVRDVARECTSLTSLDLAWSEGVTDEPLLELIAARGAHLRSLKLRCTGVTGRTLCAIGASCAAVQRLDVSRLTGVSTDDLLTLVSGCPALRFLAATWIDELDDTVAQCLWATAGRSIRVVDFEGCKRLTSDSIPPTATCRRIEVVSFVYCDSVEDVDLAAAARSAPGIRLFNYYGSLM